MAQNGYHTTQQIKIQQSPVYGAQEGRFQFDELAIKKCLLALIRRGFLRPSEPPQTRPCGGDQMPLMQSLQLKVTYIQYKTISTYILWTTLQTVKMF